MSRDATFCHFICSFLQHLLTASGKGFPGGSDGKEYACHAGDLGLIPGLGRSPGEGSGFTHSSILNLGNPMVRGALWATSLGLQWSQT